MGKILSAPEYDRWHFCILNDSIDSSPLDLNPASLSLCICVTMIRRIILMSESSSLALQNVSKRLHFTVLCHVVRYSNTAEHRRTFWYALKVSPVYYYKVFDIKVSQIWGQMVCLCPTHHSLPCLSRSFIIAEESTTVYLKRFSSYINTLHNSNFISVLRFFVDIFALFVFKCAVHVFYQSVYIITAYSSQTCLRKGRTTPGRPSCRHHRGQACSVVQFDGIIHIRKKADG